MDNKSTLSKMDRKGIDVTDQRPYRHSLGLAVATQEAQMGLTQIGFGTLGIVLAIVTVIGWIAYFATFDRARMIKAYYLAIVALYLVVVWPARLLVVLACEGLRGSVMFRRHQRTLRTAARRRLHFDQTNKVCPTRLRGALDLGDDAARLRWSWLLGSPPK
jgi:hypothetical protein